jgi:hypothetical protein
MCWLIECFYHNTIQQVADLLPREEKSAALQQGLAPALALRPPSPQVLFLLGNHLPALLEKTERAFWLENVYPALVLLCLESGLPQLQVRLVGRSWAWVGSEKGENRW